MISEADSTDRGATGTGSGAPGSADDAARPESDAVPRPDVPHLEADETVPPRPEEEVADAVRGTDSTPAGPGPG